MEKTPVGAGILTQESSSRLLVQYVLFTHDGRFGYLKRCGCFTQAALIRVLLRFDLDPTSVSVVISSHKYGGYLPGDSEELRQIHQRWQFMRDIYKPTEPS